MKRIRNIVLCVCALIGTCVHAYAGNPGSSCKDAIPMGKDYCDTVKNGETVWYSAWTFDLPLTVTFTPTNGEGEPAPYVEMDFTCTPGYYDNDILCALFCKTSGSGGIDYGIPHKPKLNGKTLDDGTFVYYLSLGERYRDMLLQAGISTNLKVVVQVVYKCDGVIKLVPNEEFTNCMDNVKFMQYGDTIHIAANDTNTHFIVPYLQWQEDSIFYKWKGDAPCELAVAKTCDFLVSDLWDGNIIDRKEIGANDSVKILATTIYNYVHNPDYVTEAGMYFAKVKSAAPGILKVTKVPQAQPDGHGTILRLGRTYPLNANTKDIFAIPRSWNIDVKFTTPTTHLFTMVLSSTANFGPSDTLATYPFEQTGNGRWVSITGEKLKTYWNKIPTSKNYIYIRFICTEATTITPDRWFVSDCYTKTKDFAVVPGQTLNITRNSSTIYRFSYSQWKGGDMDITFAINSDCYVYFADTCGMSTSSQYQNAPYWLLYKQAVRSSLPLTIPADTIAKWAEKIHDDDYFYGLFITSASSTNRNITFNTNAEAEKDPIYPASTIVVECKEGKTWVRVSKAQPIVVKDVMEEIRDEWEASPEDAHELNLPAGYYILQGEEEEMTIKL